MVTKLLKSLIFAVYINQMNKLSSHREVLIPFGAHANLSEEFVFVWR